MDLGANEWTTFRKVTLPLIAPGDPRRRSCSASRSRSTTSSSRTSMRARLSTFPIYVWGAARIGAPAAGERDRHGDLRDRRLGSARQRAHPDAPAARSRGRVTTPRSSRACRRGGSRTRSPAEAIRRRRRTWKGTRRRMSAIVGGGYTGLWTALALQRARSRACASRWSRRRSAGTGRAAATAASSTATGPRSPILLPLLGRGAALQLARAGSGSCPGCARGCESRSEDVWLRGVGGC